MRCLLITLLAGVLLAAEWPATAGDDLHLRGSGRLTWMWWKVYDVGFYLPADVPGEQVLDDGPRRIAFRYLRSFSAAELGKATTRTVFERLNGLPRAEADAGVAAINALWPAVTSGDELTLDYRPDSGLSVLLNGQSLGTVAGSGFARVLFSVWLGPDAIDKGLRRALIPR